MKVTQRADGRFMLKVTKDGKTKYLYGKSDKDVMAKYVEFQTTSISNDKLTLKELSDLWLKSTQTKNAPSSVKNNISILNNHILPEYSGFQVAKIKPIHVQDIINKITQEGKYNTAQKAYNILHSMFELAINNDYILKNPTRTVKIPKYEIETKEALTDQEKEIIENSTSKYRDFFTFLLYTGLRRGEICALTWDDIDFDNKKIVVSKSIDFSTSNQGALKSTKNYKPRNIPLLNKTADILASIPHTSQYVFTNQHGKRLTEVSLRRMLDSFKKDTGLNFSLHQLRHTFCTILYYSGISSKKAQQIMFHGRPTHISRKNWYLVCKVPISW